MTAVPARVLEGHPGAPLVAVATPPIESLAFSDRRQIKEALARELHDQLAQNMTSLIVQTEVFARDQKDRPDVVAELAFVQASLREMLNNLRQILYDLRDQPGLAKGLVPAIREGLISSYEKRTGAKVTLWVSRAWPASLPPDTSIHIFRIVQEALNNAFRHGAATKAHVALRFASKDLISITISDNGRGIPWGDEDKPIGMGLLGMQERASILGGALTIRSRPRGGTTITARLKKEALAWPPKRASEPSAIASSIMAVLSGERVMAGAVAKRVLDMLTGASTPKQFYDGLTAREVEILKLTAAGQANKQIAYTLKISEKTVRNHISHIYEKLGIYDREQAVLYAVRKALVEL